MTRSRFTVPGAVLCAFALVLPVSPAGEAIGTSAAECLTLGDHPSNSTSRPAAVLERCSAAYPDDPELLADLGAQYEASGDSGRAEEIYRRALAIDPGYADLRLRLGRLLLQRGAGDEARQQAEAALDVQPNRRALVELRDRASRVSSGAAR